MPCKQFTKEINGHKYSYTQLPATSSLRLKYKIGGIAGGAIEGIFGGVGKPKEEQMEIFVGSIEKLLSKNESDGLVDLITSIMSPVFRDKERLSDTLKFDEAYTGNIAEMYSALAWVLTCEYGGFMKGLGELL